MEMEDEALSAGLRYVSDASPGITRQLRAGTFAYVDQHGKRITNDRTLERIRSLAIPPAYRDVWICPDANGHVQATGRDKRGRKQYRYHPRWRDARDADKFHRMAAFGKALPAARKRVAADLRRTGLPREKVLAAVVRLLERTLIRVGNPEYAKQNRSYGITTLENRHVRVTGASMRFAFAGKSGIRHAIDLHDKRLARIVRSCQDLPGQHLFSYVDDTGETHAVDSSDVNEYIRRVTGDDFSAKDFRTWAGTAACAALLAEGGAAPDPAQRKQRVAEAIRAVARLLGNTPAVCRACYVHPVVIDRYLKRGKLPRQSVLTLLRGRKRV